MSKRGGDLKLDDHLCFALYGASMAVSRAYKPLLDGWGITYPQYLVLSVLWEEEPLSPGALADRLSLEPSTITPLVGRLAANGFVTRERDPADRRGALVRLTAKGRELQGERACLARTLLAASGKDIDALMRLNEEVCDLRDALAGANRAAGARAGS